MSSYNYKSISELDNALSILPNDTLLISQLNDGALITKKTTVSALLSSHDHQYLPLSGGTMTGSIKVDNITLARHRYDNSHFNIYGGTGIGNGARISLAGKDHETNPGLLLLEAHKGDLSARLALRPDGRIYLYDEVSKKYTHLVRSVNGLSANSSGNVTLASVGKLSTARTITLTGDCSGSVQFDGSENVTLNATVQDNSHDHSIDNITGLSEALDRKASTDHRHSIDNITGLSAALDGKAALSHTHDIGNITGLQEDLNNLNERLGAFSGCDRVIESSFGDKSFYIKYSSGLLIQSGKVLKADLSEEDKDKNYVIRSISLDKPFADENYYVSITPLQQSDLSIDIKPGGGTIWHLAAGARSTTKFWALVNHDNATGYEWLAIGKA